MATATQLLSLRQYYKLLCLFSFFRLFKIFDVLVFNFLACFLPYDFYTQKQKSLSKLLKNIYIFFKFLVKILFVRFFVFYKILLTVMTVVLPYF